MFQQWRSTGNTENLMVLVYGEVPVFGDRLEDLAFRFRKLSWYLESRRFVGKAAAPIGEKAILLGDSFICQQVR